MARPKGRDTSLGSEVSQGIKKPRKARKPKGRPTTTTDAVSSKRERISNAERREIRRVVTGSAQRITNTALATGTGAVEHALRRTRESQKQDMQRLAEARRMVARNNRLFGLNLRRPTLEDILEDSEESFGERLRTDVTNIAKDTPHSLKEQALAMGEVGQMMLGGPASKKEESLKRNREQLEGMAKNVVESAKDPLAHPGYTLAAMAMFNPRGFGIRRRKKGAPEPEAEASPVLGPPAPQTVADVLPAAKKARKEQAAGYKVERGKRFNEHSKAFGQAGGGLAGLRAARGELKGELPKVDFSDYRPGPEQLDRDINKVFEHPDLLDGQKQHAGAALENMALHGITPQESQIALLGKVFGDDEAAKLIARSLGDRVMDVLGLSRSMMTTLDLSLNMRQALPLLFRNPNIWRKSIGPQMKALVSKGKYKEADDLMASDPDFQLAMRVQPRLFTHHQGRQGLERSEFYPSPLAEKIPVIKHPIGASSRAFEIGQNLGILNSFKSMLARAKKRGINIDPDTPEGLRELKGMAEVAGAQVGRGIFKSKMARGAQPLLSQGFFAPSFYKSRLTWFSPRWYIKLPKVARYEALRTMGQFLGISAAGLYGVDQLTDATVSPDPRSSDFGKVRIGDTRLDTLGGFQQWARVATQIATGQYVDTNTGEVIDLKPGIGNRTRKDVAIAFASGKLSPPASFINDLWAGTDYAHQPFEWKKAVIKRMTPLVLQDMKAVYDETGSIPAAAGAYAGAAAGVGVQTYKNKEREARKERNSEFKDWRKTAETAWKKTNPGLTFPAAVLRAERDRGEVEYLVKLHEDKQEEAQAVLAYFYKAHPNLRQYDRYYQPIIRRGNEDEIGKFLRQLRYDVYGKTMENFNTIMPKD